MLNFVQSKLNPEFVQLETAQLENIQKGRCRICDESFYEPDFDCRIQEETDSAGNGPEIASAGNGPEIAWRILRLI